MKRCDEGPRIVDEGCETIYDLRRSEVVATILFKIKLYNVGVYKEYNSLLIQSNFTTRPSRLPHPSHRPYRLLDRQPGIPQ